MIPSRVRRISIEHVHTPQHQNTKCLVRATRAGGSRQHDRQVVRYQDAFSVALRSQTAGSDKLHSSAQKGTTSSASYNNQPEHQRKMPRGFCGRSPHFRRLLSGDGGYSVTYRFITIRSSVGAAGAASTHHKAVNMAME